MKRSSVSKPVIGIVGGIGSGKSTAAAAFGVLGCVVIDGDAIGHDLLKDDDVRREIHSRWGDGVFTAAGGEVDRRALGKIVFAAAAGETSLAALQRILHPRIRGAIVDRIGSADPGEAPAVVLDAAVLFEAGWDDLCSHTIFVAADAKRRIARLGGRGWDRRTLQDRESRQIPLDRKAGLCSYKLDNSSSIPHLHEQVRRLLHQITHG